MVVFFCSTGDLSNGWHLRRVGRVAAFTGWSRLLVTGCATCLLIWFMDSVMISYLSKATKEGSNAAWFSVQTDVGEGECSQRDGFVCAYVI